MVDSINKLITFRRSLLLLLLSDLKSFPFLSGMGILIQVDLGFETDVIWIDRMEMELMGRGVYAIHQWICRSQRSERRRYEPHQLSMEASN